MRTLPGFVWVGSSLRSGWEMGVSGTGLRSVAVKDQRVWSRVDRTAATVVGWTRGTCTRAGGGTDLRRTLSRTPFARACVGVGCILHGTGCWSHHGNDLTSRCGLLFWGRAGRDSLRPDHSAESGLCSRRLVMASSLGALWAGRAGDSSARPAGSDSCHAGGDTMSSRLLYPQPLPVPCDSVLSLGAI